MEYQEKYRVLQLVEDHLGVHSLSGYATSRNDKDVLLYLVKSGSHLFGTATENSDSDYKGVFMPSLQSLALGRVLTPLKYNTGNDKSKNTADDVDIELWPLTFWLNLLKKGETNATDLLFSHTNQDCLVYQDWCMQAFFNNTDKLIDSEKLYNCSYLQYAKSQATKYGLKGTRLKALEKAYEAVEFGLGGYEKLGTQIDDIVKHVNNEKYCFEVHQNGGRFLHLCGKLHDATISIMTFRSRVYADVEEYGHRAKLAMANDGSDWKALSHCLRAIYQTQELMETGKIVFPLADAPTLRQVKTGQLSFLAVNHTIEEELDLMNHIKLGFVGEWDQDFVDKCILKIYNMDRVRVK